MSVSPSYLLLTGRNGLRLFEGGKVSMAVCQHPNDPSTQIVLPLGNSLDPIFAIDLCEAIAQEGKTVKLSRVLAKDVKSLAESGRLYLEEESLLDWRYPVTILDNRAVRDMAGGALSNLRQKVSLIKRQGVIEVFDQHDERYEALKTDVGVMIESWADSVSELKGFSVEHLVSSNKYGYEMGRAALDTFQANVFLQRGKPIALYTSELPRTGRFANGITLCIDRSVRGASEFAYWWMAQELFEAGYQFTNINGAETDSLNQFRKKLKPVSRIPLNTFRYLPTQDA